MKESVVHQKSSAFAVRIVRLSQYLCSEKREFVLSKQILRSGTSIGANVEEASGGQSKRDFLSKMSIAYKEARETVYWLRLLKDTDDLTQAEFDSIHADADKLCRILSKIQTSTKQNIRHSSFPIHH